MKHHILHGLIACTLVFGPLSTTTEPLSSAYRIRDQLKTYLTQAYRALKKELQATPGQLTLCARDAYTDAYRFVRKHPLCGALSFHAPIFFTRTGRKLFRAAARSVRLGKHIKPLFFGPIATVYYTEEGLKGMPENPYFL